MAQVHLDERLIREALEVGRHKTKKDAVTAALREYIRGRKQLGILELTGQIEYDPKYDYKKLRAKKSGRAI
ncbi:MAG: type II toxin-antitoxin system VapB family antitoxin [Nitrospira sp.]|nr:type II toxin-antitoxin system VapB family antitoxin [Nitrospira sp.]